MEKPIRVLQVLMSTGCGGAENMIMNLYRTIDRSKVQFDFLIHTREQAFFDEEIKAMGGRIFCLPRFVVANYFSYCKAVDHFFDEHPEISVVHGHLGSAAGLYLNSARKHGIFAIAHSHNTYPKQVTAKNLMFRLLTEQTKRVADFYIGCSKLAGLHRFGPKIYNGDRFTVLNNAIELERFVYNEEVRNEARKELGIGDTFVVGHIGRFMHQKNHLYLLDIFAEIVKRKPDSLLMLVGDGELRGEIEAKIDALGIKEKVMMLGVRSDANRLWQAMDCFVFPSFHEGLPVTVVEAQAAGLPCIVSDTITDEVCLTDLVQKMTIEGSPEAWADAVVALSGAEARRGRAEEVKAAGYDINETALWLTDFYLKNAKIKE